QHGVSDGRLAALAQVQARQNRGVTLLELLVVIGIILILVAMFLGGMGNLSKSRKLRLSVDRVVNTLALARGQAISDNAIYHVRVENRASNDQWISVYRFPAVSDALRATDEQAVQAMGGWNPLSDPKNMGTFKNYLVSKQRLEIGDYFET